MAKWSGKIGFVTTEERPVGSGISKDVVVVKRFTGDVGRVSRRWESADKVNDDLNISNSISVVATPYLMENFYNVRFVSFMNSWWRVNTVVMDYPRLTLEIGGKYNGDTTPTAG